jgi:DNA gyrase subunit A
MLVTNRGKVIRTRVSEISEVGRNTQGVRVIRTQEEERVVAIERLVDQDDASAVESSSPVESDPEDMAEGTANGESSDEGGEDNGDA